MAEAASSVVVRLAAGQEPLSRRLEPASELVLRQSKAAPATGATRLASTPA
jgi:hypothetical protein